MSKHKQGHLALLKIEQEIETLIDKIKAEGSRVENPRVASLTNQISGCLTDHLFEIDGVLQSEYASSVTPQMKSCGANGPGGRGFQVGNTCGRRVNIGGFSVRADQPEKAIDMLEEQHEAELEAFDDATFEAEEALDAEAESRIQSIDADLEDATAGAESFYDSEFAAINDAADEKIDQINETIDGKLEALEDDDDDSGLAFEINSEVEDALDAEREAVLAALGDSEAIESDRIYAAYEAAFDANPDSTDEVDAEYDSLIAASTKRYQDYIDFYYDGVTDKLPEPPKVETKFINAGVEPGSEFNPPSGTYLQADGEKAARARAEKDAQERIQAASGPASDKQKAYEAERTERIAAVEKSRKEQQSRLTQQFDSKIALAKEKHATATGEVNGWLKASKESLTQSRTAERSAMQERYFERLEAIESEIEKVNAFQQTEQRAAE